MRANYIFEKWLNAVASKFETSTVFTRLEAGGGGGGGGVQRLFIKINLQTRLLIVARLVNEA